jgi:ParB/RepB/Spo0J family partition protein
MSKRTGKLIRKSSSAEQVIAGTTPGDSGMSRPLVQVEWAPIDRLHGHPRNPRALRCQTAEFADLVASIEADGIREPLVVRTDPLEPDRLQILSGHRRFAAAQVAGLAELPVFNQGQIPDRLAYDIVASGNLHEPLTAIEEGKRVAYWLDEYGEDVQAVAGKLGKAPRWVVEHAQIVRGLSPDWLQEAEQNQYMDRWTSSHWAVIAKLPARLQAAELSKFHGCYCSYDRWSVAELERRVQLETFELAKAPFDVTAVCEGCLSRTDVQPLLWADTAEAASGSHARCLDKKCWRNNADRAERQKVRDVAEAKGLAKPLTISTVEQLDPRDYDYRKEEDYKHKVAAARRVHKGLLEAGDYKIVEEGAEGAVAAVVVAGKGKGSVKWVKPIERKEKSGRDSGPREKKRSAAEVLGENRWIKASEIAWTRMAEAPVPSTAVVLYLSVISEVQMWGAEREEFMAEARKLAGDPGAFDAWIREDVWHAHAEGMARRSQEGDDGRKELVEVAPFFGIDLDAIYAEVVAAETPGAPDSAVGVASGPATASPLSLHDVSDAGVVQSPDLVPIDLPAAFRAKIEIRLGYVAGQWYGGWSGHLPGAGEECPCSVHHAGYASRAAALAAVRARILEWLDGKPGRRTYKHREAIRDLVAGLAPAADEAAVSPPAASPASEPCEQVLTVDLPASYRAEAELLTMVAAGQWRGGYRAMVAGHRINIPPHDTDRPFAGRRQCLEEMGREIATWMRNSSMEKKVIVQISGRIEEAIEAELTRTETDPRARHLAVPLTAADCECTLSVWRMAGRWFGSFKIAVGKASAELPLNDRRPAQATKAECLRAMVVSIAAWLDSCKREICNQRLRTEVYEQIAAAVEAEVAKRTCRVCGCTEAHCEQCVERTGAPCTWVAEDLCSACVATGAEGGRP